MENPCRSAVKSNRRRAAAAAVDDDEKNRAYQGRQNRKKNTSFYSNIRLQYRILPAEGCPKVFIGFAIQLVA